MKFWPRYGIPAQGLCLKKVLARILFFFFFSSLPLWAADASVDLSDLNMSERPVENFLEDRSASYRAILLPIEDVRISAKASGILEKYFFEEGAVVKKGDVIAQLNTEEEKTEIARAEAQFSVCQAELEKSQREFQRIENLYKEQVISPKQYEESKYQLQMAQGKLKEAMAFLEEAKNRLEAKIVRSPIDGVFFKKLRTIGESVERLEPIGRVINAAQLQMVVYCDSKHFGQIRREDKYFIELVDGPYAGEKVEATVVHVDPFLDPASGTFRIKLHIPSSSKVVAGISAELVIPEQEKDLPNSPTVIGLNAVKKSP
ncbi:efflux RND transporter periplasmic adaptor subunit [Candidatus Methylacidiphilum infernorum]|uniref:Membrane-fusion protein n=1 Tax=Methylacidiphilum infernorum (isolate V4) TaxID=481448 RepID=B3DZG8_METI4|nr:efflux RND transporter periplasmic adaptor subunit [Candidatus Methylacidiphilum infernorum]ACD82585.1 Membrane-fusion protein [Methylacidiphilum infernorum V4]